VFGLAQILISGPNFPDSLSFPKKRRFGKLTRQAATSAFLAFRPEFGQLKHHKLSGAAFLCVEVLLQHTPDTESNSVVDEEGY
jgi:hypothetical protein